MRYELTVNGEKRVLDVPANVTLLWALRDDLGLTGTRYGCGLGQSPIRSSPRPASAAASFR